MAESLAPLEASEPEPLLEEAKGLLVRDEPSDRSPVYWVYDTKTLAWKERSKPEFVHH
ncbi:MAG: hypothetical protein U0790_04710 [Isosphaeraceae bacterium]